MNNIINLKELKSDSNFSLKFGDGIYHKIEKIGSGSAGTVIKVKANTENIFYVIKIGNLIIKQNINEICVYRKFSNIQLIEHKLKIPKVHAIYKNKHTSYILMEYIGNTTLKDLKFKKNETNIRWTNDNIIILKEIIKKLLETIKIFHDHLYLVNDIKPIHIIVDKNYDIRLIDFGLTKPIEETNINIDGTPVYMPPECFGNLVERIKKRSFKKDVWSIGLTIYIAITKNEEIPFMDALSVDGSEITFELEKYDEILDNIILDLNEKLQYIDTKIRNKLVNFIESCLIVDINKRASIDDLLNHGFINNVLY